MYRRTKRVTVCVQADKESYCMCTGGQRDAEINRPIFKLFLTNVPNEEVTTEGPAYRRYETFCSEKEIYAET
jgi:hypothetical protein